MEQNLKRNKQRRMMNRSKLEMKKLAKKVRSLMRNRKFFLKEKKVKMKRKRKMKDKNKMKENKWMKENKKIKMKIKINK